MTPSTYGEGFARIYDKAGFSTFAEKMIPYLEQNLERLTLQPRSVVDLGCGTGTAAVLLAQKGLKVYGIDISRHMLEMAKKKITTEKAPVTLLHSDMRSFSLPEKVDLAISLYDSLNYIARPKELVSVFSRVKNNLNENGVFIFDMNTLYHIKHRWDNSFRVFWITDDILVIESNAHNEKERSTTKRFSFFERKENEMFERILEEHTERGYTVDEINNALVEAGLVPLSFYECFTFTQPSPKTGRIFCVSRSSS